MVYDDLKFASSEHAYLYTRCMLIGEENVADAVRNAPTPKDAKNIASSISRHLMNEWDDSKERIMYEILLSKSKCVPEFRQALLLSGSSSIVEATSNVFWGCGLNSTLAKTTLPKFYRGQNKLGIILEQLRTDLASNQEQPIPLEVSTPPHATQPTLPISAAISVNNSNSVFNTSVSSNSTPHRTLLSGTDSDDSVELPGNVNSPVELSPSHLLTGKGSTPLITASGSTCDFSIVDETHDVLSKQLFMAISPFIPKVSQTNKIVKRKTNTSSIDIATLSASPKRKASSELPSPPPTQRANMDVSPIGVAS